MKKIILSSIISLSALTIFAGGVENKTNMSAGYLRNPSRNTEKRASGSGVLQYRRNRLFKERTLHRSRKPVCIQRICKRA